MRGREEMHAHEVGGAPAGARKHIDIQGGRVGGDDGAGLADLPQALADLPL